jgi:hypothetical protein
MLCNLASNLDEKQLSEIGALEKELGVPGLAFSCHAAEPAPIEADQVAKIKQLEDKLGVSLVAVKS